MIPFSGFDYNEINSALFDLLKINIALPGLYTSTSWLDSVIDSDIKSNYTLWVADWRGYCGYDGEYGMWQYGAGYVPGITLSSQDVDV